MNEYGKVYMNLEELIIQKGISKTQLSYRSKISHTQINRFCKGDAVRIDFNTIARLCYALVLSSSPYRSKCRLARLRY